MYVHIRIKHQKLESMLLHNFHSTNKVHLPLDTIGGLALCCDVIVVVIVILCTRFSLLFLPYLRHGYRYVHFIRLYIGKSVCELAVLTLTVVSFFRVIFKVLWSLLCLRFGLYFVHNEHSTFSCIDLIKERSIISSSGDRTHNWISIQSLIYSINF